ncbi:uncharacterized protein CEXT_691591 [Caerostris extrusa]|uniref:Ig-like domain-containing protein n=1 Tax=Caerostris extrusa TaxID=172846 RepID=A0AAV4SDV4_CAEEX|nr:uncharacterized protein CEXT_691591 [Caerostris extrusa]
MEGPTLWNNQYGPLIQKIRHSYCRRFERKKLIAKSFYLNERICNLGRSLNPMENNEDEPTADSGHGRNETILVYDAILLQIMPKTCFSAADPTTCCRFQDMIGMRPFGFMIPHCSRLCQKTCFSAADSRTRVLEKVVCVAEGEPPLTYTWYNKGDHIRCKNSVFSRETPEGSSLIFDEVDLSHGGLYTCSAKNKHGTATKTYDIVVNSTSNITVDDTGSIDSVDILNITENSVTFLVKTSGDPRSFFIRYEEELDEESYEQIRKGDKAVVKGLVPSGKYQFKFQIDPPWRIKRDVKPLHITLLPAVPEVIFRSVQMRSSRIDDCVINIKIPVACSTSRYTIAGLSTGFYYEIRVRAHTKTGYGNTYRHKIKL